MPIVFLPQAFRYFLTLLIILRQKSCLNSKGLFQGPLISQHPLQLILRLPSLMKDTSPHFCQSEALLTFSKVRGKRFIFEKLLPHIYGIYLSQEGDG